MQSFAHNEGDLRIASCDRRIEAFSCVLFGFMLVKLVQVHRTLFPVLRDMFSKV